MTWVHTYMTRPNLNQPTNNNIAIIYQHLQFWWESFIIYYFYFFNKLLIISMTKESIICQKKNSILRVKWPVWPNILTDNCFIDTSITIKDEMMPFFFGAINVLKLRANDLITSQMSHAFINIIWIINNWLRSSGVSALSSLVHAHSTRSTNS